MNVFEYLIQISIDFLRFYFSVFSLVLVSIGKIYQTLKKVLEIISKHLEARQKYSAARHIFNFLLGVWKYQTWSFVCNVLHELTSQLLRCWASRESYKF